MANSLLRLLPIWLLAVTTTAHAFGYEEAAAYGAIPDDGLDDTAALQACVGALNPFTDNGRYGVGGVCQLEGGTYELHAELVLNDRVRMLGRGRLVTVLQCKGTPRANAVRIGTTPWQVFGSRVESLQIDANGICDTALYSAQANEGSGAIDVNIRNLDRVGIHLRSEPGGGNVTNCVVDQVDITAGAGGDPGDVGVLLETLGKCKIDGVSAVLRGSGTAGVKVLPSGQDGSTARNHMLTNLHLENEIGVDLGGCIGCAVIGYRCSNTTATCIAGGEQPILAGGWAAVGTSVVSANSPDFTDANVTLWTEALQQPGERVTFFNRLIHLRPWSGGSPPVACDLDSRGMMYYDVGSGTPCYCNGVWWAKTNGKVC